MVARKYGLPYHDQPTLRAAIASHLRTLRRFGSGTVQAVATSPVARQSGLTPGILVEGRLCVRPVKTRAGCGASATGPRSNI